MNDKKSVLVASAIVFRDNNGKIQCFIVKESPETDWEFPKTVVRKGESSVRAALRMLGQKAAMSARVIEEAGRSNGVFTVNGKVSTKRLIHYITITKSFASETIGFTEDAWLAYKDAVKKLTSKKEQTLLKDSYEYYNLWKKQPIRKDEDEAELEEEMLSASSTPQ